MDGCTDFCIAQTPEGELAYLLRSLFLKSFGIERVAYYALTSRSGFSKEEVMEGLFIKSNGKDIGFRIAEVTGIYFMAT
jgi:hypothetical protein